MKPIISERTITHGGNSYRVNNGGEWQALFFGTSGPNQTPHYFYAPVEQQDVPEEVVKLAIGG